ncbi:MAG: hypothetical protein KY429_05305 [Actinobacteria bacterium]|nr:hypothetical protein [Actinomycetota bacterium]
MKTKTAVSLEGLLISIAILVLAVAYGIGLFGSVEPLKPVLVGMLAAAALAAAVMGTGHLIARPHIRRAAQTKELSGKELETLKTEFLATVSQELKMPTAAIVGLSAALTDMWQELEDEGKRGISLRLMSNAEHLNTLITDLLDLSRMEAGVALPCLKPIEVSEAIKRTVEALAIHLNHHRLQVHAPSGLVAMADQVGVRRVLEALLTNAAKFSPADCLIIVRAHLTGDEVIVSVDDNGIGIPEEEIDRIFDRFYRIEEGDLRVSGIGIGLAVAKSFVKAMGGRIWVETVAGRGSTFSFSLSRAKSPSALSDLTISRGELRPATIQR